MNQFTITLSAMVVMGFSTLANADIVALHDYSNEATIGQDASGNGNTLNANGDAQIINGKLVLSGAGSLWWLLQQPRR